MWVRFYEIKTNWMHYLSSVYFVSQPLHVSGITVAHHQEVYRIYTTDSSIPTWPTDIQLKNTTRTNCCIYIYSIPPDDGLQVCPKHVEVDWRNKPRINSASSWFSLHRYIEMHSQQNIKWVILFTILKMLVSSQYIEHCYMAGGCIYNRQKLELSFMWTRYWLVVHPVTGWGWVTLLSNGSGYFRVNLFLYNYSQT
jgi:hypothetical protein